MLCCSSFKAWCVHVWCVCSCVLTGQQSEEDSAEYYGVLSWCEYDGSHTEAPRSLWYRNRLTELIDGSFDGWSLLTLRLSLIGLESVGFIIQVLFSSQTAVVLFLLLFTAPVRKDQSQSFMRTIHIYSRSIRRFDISSYSGFGSVWYVFYYVCVSGVGSAGVWWTRSRRVSHRRDGRCEWTGSSAAAGSGLCCQLWAQARWAGDDRTRNKDTEEPSHIFKCCVGKQIFLFSYLLFTWMGVKSACSVMELRFLFCRTHSADHDSGGICATRGHDGHPGGKPHTLFTPHFSLSVLQSSAVETLNTQTVET